MASDLILGVDLGTTSVKAAIYTLRGNLVFSGSVLHEMKRPHPGWAEQRPQDWIDSIVRLLRDASGQLDLSRIAAMGICSQVNTHIFLDENLDALAPAIVWQDQRCDGTAETLASKSLELDLGLTIDSSSLLSRAQWMQESRPEIWRRTKYIMSPKDYCLAVLTGEVMTDALSAIGIVSDKGIYNTQLDSLVPCISIRLPPLKSISHLVGRINHADMPIRCPVSVGTMDAWASFFGSGAVDVGTGFYISGTSEIIGALSPDSCPSEGIITFPPLFGPYLHAGPTQCGGDALAWFAQSIGLEVSETLALADDVPDSNEPLLFLPHLVGERAPLWNPDARGAFIGLTRTHTSADMALAVLHGVGFSARQLLSSIENAAGFELQSLRLSGGGARSDLWCQIKADILGRALHRVKNIDSGTFGASLIAAVGIGEFADMETAAGIAVEIDREFHPNPQKIQKYQQLYDLYRASYAGLEGVFAELSRLNAR